MPDGAELHLLRQHALRHRAEPADEHRERHARDVDRGVRRVEQRRRDGRRTARRARARARRARRRTTVACHVTSACVGAAALDDRVLAEAPDREPVRGHAQDRRVGDLADHVGVKEPRHHERADHADRAPADARRDRPQRTACGLVCQRHRRTVSCRSCAADRRRWLTASATRTDAGERRATRTPCATTAARATRPRRTDRSSRDRARTRRPAPGRPSGSRISTRDLEVVEPALRVEVVAADRRPRRVDDRGLRVHHRAAPAQDLDAAPREPAQHVQARPLDRAGRRSAPGTITRTSTPRATARASARRSPRSGRKYAFWISTRLARRLDHVQVRAADRRALAARACCRAGARSSCRRRRVAAPARGGADTCVPPERSHVRRNSRARSSTIGPAHAAVHVVPADAAVVDRRVVVRDVEPAGERDLVVDRRGSCGDRDATG